MASRTLLRYVELKTGYSDDGPAWIARVRTSKSGKLIYFRGKALAHAERGRHFDVETREFYWVSGVKKNGADRHWAGGGKVSIERGAVDEYLRLIGASQLDHTLVIVDDAPAPDLNRFHALANHSSRNDWLAELETPEDAP
ncbi:MAG: hypothetical protein JWN73_1384 [Betaproteobacteria bacterium]|nr:hypothetical protein [Betaproteobacteria bacterium]